MPKVAVRLDKEDSGLPQLASHLQYGPKARRIALVVCDASKVETDMDTGAVTVTVRISRLEEVLAEDLPTAVTMLQSSLDARFGALGDDATKAGTKPGAANGSGASSSEVGR